jgi:hypothetical protein
MEELDYTCCVIWLEKNYRVYENNWDIETVKKIAKGIQEGINNVREDKSFIDVLNDNESIILNLIDPLLVFKRW